MLVFYSKSQVSRQEVWRHFAAVFVGAELLLGNRRRIVGVRVPVGKWSVTFDAYDAYNAGMSLAAGGGVMDINKWRTRARAEFRDVSRLRFALHQKQGENIYDDFAHLRGGERRAVLSFSGAPANKSFVLKSNNSSVARQLLQQPAARNALLNLYPPLFTIRAPSLIVPLLPPPLRARYGSELHTLHLECAEFVRDAQRLSAICGLFATLLPRLEAPL